MRRLYLQIYLSFVGIVVLFGVIVSATWVLMSPSRHERQMYEGLAAAVQELLPGPEAPPQELQAVVDKFARHLLSDVTIRDADGRMLASVGEPVPLDPRRSRGGWMRTGARGWVFAVHLPDGRWLLARHSSIYGGMEWLVGLGLLAVVIAIGAYPVARRITRRLERLRTQVEALGPNDLSARVTVDGQDEVAALARSFNDAVAQIERLLNAQRSMLASASHELRSPLARLRMAFELIDADARPELKARIERDIRELDDLIDELLLASRLDAIDRLERKESIDLLALVAEEGARAGAEVHGEAVQVRGDRRMLRRLVRNLFENAKRHGGGPVEASVSQLPEGGGRLAVMDRGCGVPEAERERIFEPFYRPAGMREDGTGVGLGLALVRQIARHHGGEVHCLPREGGGSCFEVVLRSHTADGHPTAPGDSP